MHRSHTTVRSAILALVFLPLGLHAARAAEPSVESRARDLIQNGNAAGAVDLLESAILSASANTRPALLSPLSVAYEAALKQAEAAGHADQARELRDNLAIVRRKLPARPAQSPPPPPRSPAPALEPLAERPLELPAAKAEDRPKFDLDAEPTTPLPRPEPLPPPAPMDAPVAQPVSPREGPSVTDADAAFAAKRYETAGASYAALERAGALPAERRPHWAYCRAFVVVKRINERPATKTEWASIDAEIRQIGALSPSFWFGEYLRNLASERSRGAQLSARSPARNNLVVRGSSPEEAPLKTTRLQGSTLDWVAAPVQSLNFHVYYVGGDPTVAQRVARAAEEARALQVKRWGVAATGAGWSPKCEILLYPGAEVFSRDTQQPPDSPGFSTMGMNAGRLVFRRVNLRADHPNMVKAILPHEVTHVVLADLFPRQQIPRWADEGLAVLAEPASEQALRAADLEAPLKAGRLFRLNDLMAMDYPKPEHWSLYYAQSVSLTRFLVDAGTPAQFIKFVQSAQESGFEPALRDVYAIDSYAVLQERWVTYARDHAAASTVASTGEGKDKAEATQR